MTPLAVAFLVAAGCGNKPTDAPPPTIEPASAAIAPPVTAKPAGTVRPLLGGAQSAVFDAAGSALVVLTQGDNGDGALRVFDTAGGQPRAVQLPAPATALTDDGRGTVLLTTRGGYFSVELAGGSVTRVDVDGAGDTDFTAIARRADGQLVLGSADGTVYTLTSPTAVAHREKIFSHVDSIVTQGNTAVVLDRGQTSVTTIDADGTPQHALRAGEGATTLAADPVGRVLVADTRGDELLVFGVDPLIMRQRYPVVDAPYGLVGTRTLAWVSQTAANVVVGYDLATGIPVEKVRYPTVQQPNSLAYDEATGTLYVASGSGAGVQVIENAAAGNR